MVNCCCVAAILVIFASVVWTSDIPHDHMLVEGDMVMSKEEYHWRRTGMSTYMMTADVNKRWPNATLWYTIAMTYYGDAQLKEMQWAFDQFEQETCLKFRPAKKDTPNYLMVRLGNSGCNSQVGVAYSYPMAQTVNLGSGCRHYGLYLHEFGHSIGLFHEHQHKDRQLNFNLDNVQPNMKIWFEVTKEPYLTYGAPYDVQSIMHYGETAFAKKDGLITMTTKDPKLQKYLIPVWLKDLSFYDAWKINIAYKCAAHCNVKCPADTFVNKDCKCVTKQEFAKRRCIDTRSDCPQLADQCTSNRAWMWKYCRKTCGKCYEAI